MGSMRSLVRVIQELWSEVRPLMEVLANASGGSSTSACGISTVGINLEVNWNAVLRPKALAPFRVHRGLAYRLLSMAKG